MKKILLMIAGVFITYCTQAQITLNYSNAPSISQCQIPDTFTRLKLTGLPAMTASANATWDFTTAGDSTNFSIPGGAASNSAFPNAKFQSSAYYAFSGLSYSVWLMKNIAANGSVIYGLHVDRQALSLAALTGNTSDSVVFTEQDITYGAEEREVVYPTTMSDSWTDVIDYSTDFSLTITAYSLNNTPGERRTQLTINNTVEGWGKMRVNDGNGNPTGYMDVLMIKTERTARDSFFLNGSPAPASLLTAFGLSQGQLDPSYYYTFRRAGEYVELVYAKYTDNTYTTVERCDVHQQRLAPTSIKEIEPNYITVYPNPVTNGLLTIKLGVPYNELQYELISMTGQIMQQGNVPQNGRVQLEEQLPTGNYIIKLQTETGAQGTKRLSIVK